MGMFVRKVRDIRQYMVICNNKRSGFSPCRRFVFKFVSTRNVSSTLYLCCEKGFVVTTIGKVVNKSISTLYVTVMAGTDAAKAKCKAVRNRAFSVMRMKR